MQAAGNTLLNEKKSHDVQKLIDLQVWQMIFNLENCGHFPREPIVTGRFTAAVSPLSQTNDNI